MTEADSNRRLEPDSNLFSAEELAMMNEAVGDGPEAPCDVESLQAQVTAVARLVAEGGERERQLRALIHDLSLLSNVGDQQKSFYEQTQNLARVVIASSERELQLQQCLETVRAAVLVRARNAV